MESCGTHLTGTAPQCKWQHHTKPTDILQPRAENLKEQKQHQTDSFMLLQSGKELERENYSGAFHLEVLEFP